MSIKVYLDRQLLDAPQGEEQNRPKIRVQLPPEPPPPKVMAFWFAEDRQPPPWRYTESLAEQSEREQAESNGAWAGL